VPDTCVFCGAVGTNFKPEHWVPQWVSRASIPKGKGILHLVKDRDPWPHRLVDLTVRHVCPDCNHHWMSDIESQSRSVVLPLIQGAEDITLDERAQRQLATWCFLKVITLELGRPADEPTTYPPTIYEGFKAYKHPSTTCLITIGFREMSNAVPVFVWFKSQAQTHHTGPLVGDVPGYRTTLTIGHLVLDVIGLLDPRTKPVMEDSDDRLLTIWPVQPGGVNWPPSKRFSGIANDDLV
jgi:hypothetical protein